MATANVIDAVLSKFDELSAGGFPSSTKPPVAFDEVPLVDATGAELSAESGLVALRNVRSQVVGRVTEGQILEAYSFTWEIYYPSLGDALTAADAIRKNGGTLQQGLGFDNGTITELGGTRVNFDCLYVGSNTTKEPGAGKTGKLIHCHRLNYVLTAREVT